MSLENTKDVTFKQLDIIRRRKWQYWIPTQCIFVIVFVNIMVNVDIIVIVDDIVIVIILLVPCTRSGPYSNMAQCGRDVCWVGSSATGRKNNDDNNKETMKITKRNDYQNKKETITKTKKRTMTITNKKCAKCACNDVCWVGSNANRPQKNFTRWTVCCCTHNNNNNSKTNELANRVHFAKILFG